MRRWLSFGAAALLLAFGTVVIASVIETRSIARNLEQIRERFRPRAEAAYEIEINLFEVSNAVLRFLTTPDSAIARTFREERRQLDSAVAAYAERGRSDDRAIALSDRLRVLVARHDSLADFLVEERARPRFESTSSYRAARAQYTAVQTELEALLDGEVQPAAIAEWHAEADRTLSVSRSQNVIILLVAVLGATMAIAAGALTLRAYAEVERARTRAELSSQQKTEFASITAHELRSPLTATLGSLRMMASGRGGVLPPMAASYVDMASRNCARMMELINELLELDRLEAGMLPFTRAAVSAGDIVHSACAAMDPLADELEVRIREEVATARGVMGDRDRLRQVVVNLISNALKYAPRDTEVVARVADRGSRIRISVRDNGPGIAPADRERIFQRFVQTGSASQHASTGLGLAIAREIVQRHGGEIGVDSEVGQGSTFWFDLPASSA